VRDCATNFPFFLRGVCAPRGSPLSDTRASAARNRTRYVWYICVIIGTHAATYTRAPTRNAIDDKRMTIDPSRRDHNSTIIRANDDNPDIFTAITLWIFCCNNKTYGNEEMINIEIIFLPNSHVNKFMH